MTFRRGRARRQFRATMMGSHRARGQARSLQPPYRAVRHRRSSSRTAGRGSKRHVPLCHSCQACAKLIVPILFRWSINKAGELVMTDSRPNPSPVVNNITAGALLTGVTPGVVYAALRCGDSKEVGGSVQVLDMSKITVRVISSMYSFPIL